MSVKRSAVHSAGQIIKKRTKYTQKRKKITVVEKINVASIIKSSSGSAWESVCECHLFVISFDSYYSARCLKKSCFRSAESGRNVTPGIISAAEDMYDIRAYATRICATHRRDLTRGTKVSTPKLLGLLHPSCLRRLLDILKKRLTIPVPHNF